ncbi:MAG: efflux RND transporter periplasmic adaptor subunit [Gemmatimonadaceae bacterium]|nr:efflux RND transporter periplasmic adaptor subunit [Gemmatimonadaceae bacterium]
MTTEARVGISWPALVGGALVFVARGAVGPYVGLRPTEPARPDSRAPAETTGRPDSSAATADPSVPLPDVTVTLAPDAVERAGIVVATVGASQASGGLRVPGVIMPNAYRQVAVTPLVGGRVTRVTAELGDTVQRGQTVAQVFSPELADAQARYVSTRAELAAHEQELARVEKLAAIGAASQQERERIHAEHAAREADLERSAAQLELFGLSAEAIGALTPGSSRHALVDVPAPTDGVVTERTANVGLNVESTTPLLTVTDLSTVWVVVEVYEKDFDRVRVGSPASISTHAYPGRVLKGRVSYIDPQVSLETRTAKARIEVPNARHDLRLGMYAEAVFEGDAADALLTLPRGAVQHVGDRTVVYLVDHGKAGTFIEREVRLGAAAGDSVPVVAGVQAGDVVVSEGSFSVRAERERLGLRALAETSVVQGRAGANEQRAAQGRDAQEASVIVSDTSFQPSRLTLRAGIPARLTFTRTSETTCATSVVFASLNITRDLPLNQAVTVEFTPDKTGEIAFACGMNMLRGTLVVN